MRQLDDLVRADSLIFSVRQKFLHVFLGRNERADAASRESDFRGGSEHIESVRIPRFFGSLKNVFQLVVVGVKSVREIGVVPKYPEIRRGGFHFCDSVHRLIRIYHARRVAVFRNAPHSLDFFVYGAKHFHKVHIRPRFGHRNGYHFDAERLCYGKVAVVSRCRAQKLDALPLPRQTAADAEGQSVLQSIVHNVQAAAVKGNHLLIFDVENFGKKLSQLQNAFKTAVISYVGAVFGLEVAEIHREHSVGKLQLFFRRLAAGNVDVKLFFGGFLI